jgi:molybdate transport system substrate-binding protein
MVVYNPRTEQRRHNRANRLIEHHWMTKKYHKILPKTALLFLALSVIAGTFTAQARDITTLFVAASLAPVIQKLVRTFSEETGHAVRISAAASSVLARQISSGAPADIIVVANPAWMQWLEDRNLINEKSRRDLIGNQIALLRHTDTNLPENLIPALTAALKSGRIAMADPDHVPAGIYGKSALTALGLWPAVAPALARSASAPAAVALLSRGEVAAAISYQTDARLSTEVSVHTVFPQNLYPNIRYQIATIANSTNQTANLLMKYLGHSDRLAVFEAAGFTPLASP